MREFSLNIEEHFTNGLSPDERTKRNVPFLFEAQNIRCTPFGIKEYVGLTDPFEGSISEDFPFPQIFQTSRETLLATRNKVYVVDTSIIPWQRTELQTLSIQDNPSPIVEGGRWHFVDATDMWMLFNGECIVYRDTQEVLENRQVRVRSISDVKIQSGCHHRGRIVVGGFDPEQFWGGEWDKIFRLLEDQLSAPFSYQFDDMDKNFVMWSSIGGGDFPLWLFKPEAAVYSNVRDHSDDYGFSWERIDTTMLIDVLRRNEFGFMPMSWNGRVIGIAPILDKLVVLGTEGVTGLVLANTGETNTYGRRDLLSTGCAGRGAFHASNRRVLFIDSEGSLWQVSSDLQPSRIGYRKYFAEMLGTEITINWNEEEDEYIISNSDHSFQYTQSGLSRLRQSPTTMLFYQGGNVGVVKEISDEDITIVTEVMDLGARSLKTITNVNLGVQSRGLLRVAFDYRYNSNEEFRRTEFMPVNKEGIAYLRITCLDFRLVISGRIEGLNILERSDVESWEWNTVGGWLVSGTDTATINSEEAYYGDNSLRVRLTGNIAAQRIILSFNNRIPVTPGSTISFYGFFKKYSTSPQNALLIRVFELDVSNSQRADPVITRFILTDDWKLQGGTLKLRDDTTNIRMAIEPDVEVATGVREFYMDALIATENDMVRFDDFISDIPFELDYATIKYQFSDNRNQRGSYANTAIAGEGV